MDEIRELRKSPTAILSYCEDRMSPTIVFEGRFDIIIKQALFYIYIYVCSFYF